MKIICIVLTICLTGSSVLAVENWPQFRGPSGDGVINAGELE